MVRGRCLGGILYKEEQGNQDHVWDSQTEWQIYITKNINFLQLSLEAGEQF